MITDDFVERELKEYGWQNCVREDIKDENNDLIGYSILDYFPTQKSKDKVYKYINNVKDINILMKLLTREKERDTFPRIDMIEWAFIGEKMEPFSMFVKDCKEIWVHFGCAAVKLTFLRKYGLLGFEYIAKVTHAGTAEKCRKRAKFFYEFLNERTGINL